MIVKKLVLPRQISKLQALSKRLRASHDKFTHVQNDLGRFLAGYNGEKALQFHLTPLSSKDTHLLHNVRLFHGKQFSQMDLLIVTRKFVLILEVKYMSGMLHFDRSFGQLLQHKNGVERAFTDPMFQLERQVHLLTDWMEKRYLPRIPVHGLVVMSHPHAILKGDSSKQDSSIIRPASIIERVAQLEEHYREPFISIAEMKKISHEFMRWDTSHDESVLQTYKLDKEDILCGVICHSCGHMPLDRIHGSWRCGNCTLRMKTAHHSALSDYFLLFGPTITNRKMRWFFHIQSTFLANRLLQFTPHLTKSGHYKSTVYTISEQINL